MNSNIDRKTVRLFNRLARKHKSIIREIRKIYFDEIRDEYIVNGELNLKDADLLAHIYTDKMSNKALLEFWEDYHDCDNYVIPKSAIKNLSEKELELLDIEL